MKTHCVNGHEIAVVGRTRGGHCTICAKEKSRRHYLANRERYLAEQKAKRDAERAAGIPPKDTLAWGRKKNGVKNATNERRTGPCDCCRKSGPLVLDHDHVTGTARGWLCRTCNTGIGHLGDTLAAVNLAVGYLARYEG